MPFTALTARSEKKSADGKIRKIPPFFHSGLQTSNTSDWSLRLKISLNVKAVLYPSGAEK